ncbi:sterol desaturase family protein [Mycobacterium sp. PSTR-4-N]|uniref:sterol desaturase family protein n=1 Tax=Mycobacterium sp. PSTR-4-N TaxID=2917745 RepID=UPI001F14C9AF|nr:sterol desaturase family protein [Mycobacterium sp. PSTR-4-N]MCG7597396.1 sterol desaturase family protein [Mycobacterium sp. PSTR-4-N]
MTSAPVRPTRRQFTLGDAAREFAAHPSPWMIGTTLAAALTARLYLGDWTWTDAVVPVVMLAVFPFFEWVVHVCILHWKPRRIAGLRIDSLLARKHREHHVDPRDVALIFIPWPALLWVLPVSVAIALLAFPRPALGLTFLTFLAVLGLCYEWCHYLVHSDYKPKTAVYRAVWRNHRQHHFKNEHYWFTVTSAGTADRVLGTCPSPTAVETSPTAKNLHGQPT